VDVNIDKNYFIQGLINILINAVHSSQPDAVINIKTTVIDGNNGAADCKVCIEIIDNGISIPDDAKETIFDYDFSENKSIKVQGVNLFLVKKIIRAHNGIIEVKDNKPSGSIFRIII